MPAHLARVALVGAGTIAARYVEGLRRTPGFDVKAVCARTEAGAQAFAAEHRLAASSLDGILGDPSINYVLNLSPAGSHEAVTRACLDAGKSVYSEKPLAATLAEADALIALAERRRLLLACAPATYLWPPLATARRFIHEGHLGPTAGAVTTLVYPGPELFHPRPAHLYGPSAGPLHDMGVYQVTALMWLLGPVTHVVAMASRMTTRRSILVGSDAGQTFPVHVPTHVHAQLLHAAGAISSLIVSFDGLSASAPSLDLFGREGGLSIKNVHAPDALLTLRKNGAGASENLSYDEPEWSEARWAVGPTSAWSAYRSQNAVRTSAQRARSVLEVLLAVENASLRNEVVELEADQAWL